MFLKGNICSDLLGFNFVSVDHEKQKLIEEFLDEKNLQYLDLPALLSVLSFLKELELKDEEIVDNEYGKISSRISGCVRSDGRRS